MKRYSAFSNILYLLRRINQYNRWYLPLQAGLLAVNMTLPMIATLLPTTAVGAITRGGGLEQYLAAVTAMVLLYAVLTFLRHYWTRWMLVCQMTFRGHDCVASLAEKVLTADYCLLEPAEGQRRMDNAHRSISRNSVGVERMLTELEPLVRNLLGVLLYGALAVALDWRILLVLAGMTACNCLAARWAHQYALRTQKGQQAWDIQRERYFQELAADPANGKDIRLYRLEKWLMDALRACVKRQGRWRWGLYSRRVLGEISDSLFLVARDLIAYGVLTASFLAGEIDAAAFTFHMGVIATFTTWLNGFVTAFNDLNMESLRVCDYREFLGQEDVMNHGNGVDTAGVQCPPEIELRDVSFTYPGQSKPTISHLSLTIRAGEKIALVGLNGAGKTTLVKLLSGLYKPTGGQILAGGVPLEEFHIQEWQKLVGTLYQDAALLPFTVGENVAGKEEYDRETVWQCLEKAGLRETVEKLPKGLDTALTRQLEPEGVDLSGGQRQRLLLARALYKDAPLLILDEPTAALDPLAEADLYQKYAGFTGGKTSLFISHRLSSTQFCDRVVYMEGGRIREIGTHRELLERGGAYAHLFEVQSSYYREGEEYGHEEI